MNRPKLDFDQGLEFDPPMDFEAPKIVAWFFIWWFRPSPQEDVDLAEMLEGNWAATDGLSAAGRVLAALFGAQRSCAEKPSAIAPSRPFWDGKGKKSISPAAELWGGEPFWDGKTIWYLVV